MALPDPATIAAAVRASRAEFADLFVRAQARHGVPVDRRVTFEAEVSAVAGGDAAAFRRAAEAAFAGGWTGALVVELIQTDREDGTLRLAWYDQLPGTEKTALQAIFDRARGLIDPGPYVRGLDNGMRWTCKVVIDNQARGTGVLVAPHLVLTAWHVVAPLGGQPAGQPWQPDPAAAGRLVLVFDDLLVGDSSGLAPRTPQKVGAHRSQPWCPVFRPCHPAELNHQLPADLAELDGKWDFAVVRLAKPVGLVRGYAACNPLVTVPAAGEPVCVFQHAAGGLLKFDEAPVAAPAAAAAAAVPRLRFLHTASTAGGSSGGPCFDRLFYLCGLHQGVWAGGAAAGPANRGVPLARVCDDLGQPGRALPPFDPADRPLAGLGPDEGYAPVVGCDGFQQAVWEAAAGRRPLVLVPDDNRAQTGKSFRLKVVRELLPEQTHLRVLVETPAHATRPAAEFAAALCRLAGAAAPAPEPPDLTDSTRAVWVKDQLVPAVLAELERVRGGRQVWLLLKDLNHCDDFGALTSEFLYHLYGQVLTAPGWLRVVLDGMRGELPDALRLSTGQTPVAPLTVDDVRACLDRRLRELGITPGPDLGAWARGLHRRYQQARPEKAAAALKVEVLTVLADYQDEFAP